MRAGAGRGGQHEAVIVVRVLSADDWAQWRELRLAALAEAPDAFGARLADWQGEGDVEERWRRRLTDVEFNVVAEFEGKPAGLVSGAVLEDGTARLISMWVAPFARGHGVGDTLVHEVVRWAAGRRLVLGVFEHNEVAKNLYQRNGFVPGALLGREREMVHRGSD